MRRQIVVGGAALGWPGRILFGALAVALILLGVVFGAVMVGLGVAAVMGMAVRLWWLRWRARRSGGLPDVTVIDGEYRVLERRREDRNGGPDV